MGMTKAEIQEELKGWGYSEETFKALDWPDLQSFYSKAKDDQQAKESDDSGAADNAVASGDGGSDEPGGSTDEAAPTKGPDDSAGDDADKAATPAGDAKEESLEEAEQSGLDGDLVKAEVLTGCTVKSLGVIYVGEADPITQGKQVKLEAGQPIALDKETFEHLRQYRLVRELS